MPRSFGLVGNMVPDVGLTPPSPAGTGTGRERSNIYSYLILRSLVSALT
jgi:hypothetical protein